MADDKPKYAVGCTGHIDLSRIKDFEKREQALRADIRAHFEQLEKTYAVTLYSGLANGADTVFAQEALAAGINVVAVLPEDMQAFINEQNDKTVIMRLLHAASERLLCPNGYVGIMDKIISISDEIVTLWDGVELPLTDKNGRAINRGGTYDVIRTARLASKKITHFNSVPPQT